MAGDYVTREIIHPFPGMPNGGKATSKTRSRMALNDFALLQDYEQKMHGRIMFRGHGILRYDLARKQYEMHWFDSLGGPDNVLKGDFDGKRLTLSGKDRDGQKIRLLYDLHRDGGYYFEMQMSPNGRRWETIMEGDVVPEGRAPTSRPARSGRAATGVSGKRPATTRAAARATAERHGEFRQAADSGAERKTSASRDKGRVAGKARSSRPSI